ncbi:hypothetical protein [Jannaschia formosa]|uniref:hypothetical protein n=1 Tax=Jannaschia formosa TaxID=2259592 RepID=UPI00143001F2|nr:hypothetical protein [Jannaschia formosa]
MRLFVLALSACLIAAPAMAQKFVSVTGESTRMTIGAIAAGQTETAEPVPEADAETETDEAEVAEAEVGTEAEELAAPVNSFIDGAGVCNPGLAWNQTTGRCETF